MQVDPAGRFGAQGDALPFVAPSANKVRACDAVLELDNDPACSPPCQHRPPPYGPGQQGRGRSLPRFGAADLHLEST